MNSHACLSGWRPGLYICAVTQNVFDLPGPSARRAVEKVRLLGQELRCIIRSSFGAWMSMCRSYLLASVRSSGASCSAGDSCSWAATLLHLSSFFSNLSFSSCFTVNISRSRAAPTMPCKLFTAHTHNHLHTISLPSPCLTQVRAMRASSPASRSGHVSSSCRWLSNGTRLARLVAPRPCAAYKVLPPIQRDAVYPVSPGRNRPECGQPLPKVTTPDTIRLSSH